MARTTLRIPCWARLRCSDADARGATRDACHCSRRKNGERRETARERRRGPWRPTGSGGCPGSSPSFRCCPSGSTPRLRQYLGMRWDSMGWDGRQRHLPAGSGFFRPPQWFTRSLFRLCSCGLVCGANWRWCQTAYKPGSVRTAHGFPWAMRDDHSSGTHLSARLARPTRTAERECSCALRRGRPYSVLLPVGFALPPLLPGARCALAAPFRPCPRAASPRLARAVCFLWHFPWGRPRRTLSGTVFPWSPDFPLPDPRGKPGDKQRPSGRLAIHHWRGIAEPVKRRVARSQ